MLFVRTKAQRNRVTEIFEPQAKMLTWRSNADGKEEAEAPTPLAKALETMKVIHEISQRAEGSQTSAPVAYRMQADGSWVDAERLAAPPRLCKATTKSW